MTYVALLRAVNVGGSGKLPMARLRQIAVECGLRDPRTYIQSGNLVFEADEQPTSDLAARLAQSLDVELGAPCPVVVLTAAELARARDANPFLGRPEAGPRELHAVFALPGATQPDPATLPDPGAFAPSEYAIIGDVLYLYLPDGIGRSKLAATLTKPGGFAGTARNWRTVETLAAMAGA